MINFTSSFVIAVLVVSSAYSRSVHQSPESAETQSQPDNEQQSESARAGPLGIKPPSLTTEKPIPSTEQPASAPGFFGGGSEGEGIGFPSLPGGSSSSSQGVRPALVMGAFQAIITPFDPSMMGSLIGALGGGGAPSFPSFPTGSGSQG